MVYPSTEHQFADRWQVLRSQELLLIRLPSTPSTAQQCSEGGRLVHEDWPKEVRGHGHRLDEELVLPTQELPTWESQGVWWMTS